MECNTVENFTDSIGTGDKEEKYEFYSYISDNSEQYERDSHDHMFHILKTYLESGKLVSGMSKVLVDTYGCAKQYRCALAI